MTPSRIELLRLLAELSNTAPDLRLGQLIANLATHARGPAVESIWESTDDELAAAAKRLLESYRKQVNVA